VALRAQRWGMHAALGLVAAAAVLAAPIPGPALASGPRHAPARAVTTRAGHMPPRAASLPGPANLSLGLVDDPLFVNSPDSVRGLWLSRAQAVGSTTVRLPAWWALIAPSNPMPTFRPWDPADSQYRWGYLDAAVRAANAHGQTIVIMAREAPPWAEGADRPANFHYLGVWRPDPAAFAQFAHALALRYSGSFPDPVARGQALPRVRYFQAWNEPNLPNYISPQWGLTSDGTYVPLSPDIYRSLLNAFYSAVKSVQPDAVVLAAGTAPYGDPPGQGGQRMAPVTFYKEMFCLTSQLVPQACPDPPHFDALDHHPYSVAPTAHAGLVGDIGVPDLNKIWRILHAAQRAGRALPAGAKALWVTEIDWASIPPVTLPVQARYLALGFYELWSQGVTHAFWFQLRDPHKTNSFAAGGLYPMNGPAKPAAAAFRFPFVALPGRRRQVTLWGKAPVAGTVVIQKLGGGSWRRVLSLRTTGGGIFYAQRRLGPHLQLRAVIRGFPSPTWATG
jgi:hypothetical protein